MQVRLAAPVRKTNVHYVLYIDNVYMYRFPYIEISSHESYPLAIYIRVICINMQTYIHISSMITHM